MERALFVIEPQPQGWSVSGELASNHAYPTKLQAIQHASLLSYTHHMMTGRSTGVKVRTECGDEVMVGMHG